MMFSNILPDDMPDGLSRSSGETILPDPVHEAWFLVDGEGRIVLSNKCAEKSFGLQKNALLVTLYPDLWQPVQAVIIGKTGHSVCSVRIGGRDYVLRVRAYRGGLSHRGALCSLEEKGRFEAIVEELFHFRRTTAELETIINSSHDGLWICDADAKVVRINPASERINGIKAEDVVGRSMKELVEEGFVNKSATLEVLRTGKVVHLLQETRTGRKLIVTGTPVFDDNGNIVRVVVTERDITEIEELHRELLEREALKNEYLEQILKLQLEEMMSHQIIARSPAMLKVLDQAVRAARVDSTVLLLGESGVGKGLIAELIHKYSHRAYAPFMKINCAALPDSLVESELFGYEAGAFTGARKSGKPGLLEVAHGGTVLLDEVGELSQETQAKLLHFLEDGRFTRVGGTKRRSVNVRIIAATNRPLDDLVRCGKFRQDLYYRLNVIPIRVPPLRERTEDILPLLDHYIRHFSRSMGAEKRLSPSVLRILVRYDYPGNVRELMNLCERLVAMSYGDVIGPEDLPEELGEMEKERRPSVDNPIDGAVEKGFREIIEEFEERIFKEMLSRYRTQQKIAEVLKINQSTVARKLKKYGLS
ncbi:sigma-54 interaction domain-containing protein [Thermodesulforhabdus norvegica]|uniref:HTH-type transcriptional regulatory protein TyrR n=1 Tax=Thermodesulforhabdus norvegica TaxID=39841 RepID=A0A1I4UL99_9BACT|nr:sigma 54-interacting transcriptional regulator [Thermodesulforhabdus norvegica]SFM89767.1 PAS domain S-box-containing protein [Thermodesulforhabdus norvegica]